MKRKIGLLVIGMGLLLNGLPVHADLIWEPMEDPFYAEYADECEYANRTYVAKTDEVVVYESPTSHEKVDVWEKGKSVYISFVYEDEKGVEWGIYDNGDETQSGWIRMEDMALKYDSLAFREEYAEKIMEEAVTVGSGEEMTIGFWTYPGAKGKNDVKIGEEGLTLYETFTDEAGHKWAYVGYYRAMKNYWVCVDAPSAEFEELYPDGAPARGVILEGTDTVVVDGTQSVADSGQAAVGGEIEKTGTEQSADGTEAIPQSEQTAENQVPFVGTIVAGVVAVTGILLAVLKKSFRAKK